MTYFFEDITGCDDCSENFHKKHQNIYLNSFYFVKKIEQIEKQTLIDKNIISLIEEFLNIHYLFYDIYDNLLIYQNLDNLSVELEEIIGYNYYNLGFEKQEYLHDAKYVCQKCKKFYLKDEKKKITFSFLFNLSTNVCNLLRILVNPKIVLKIRYFLEKNKNY